MTYEAVVILYDEFDVLFVSDSSAEDVTQQKSLDLTLPSEFFAVAGVPISLYFDNIILTPKPEDYRFEVNCEIGETEQRRWTVTPTDEQVGTHRFSIEVSDRDGNVLANAATTLCVIPSSAGTGRDIRLLIVGDSLTHATMYPNELARLLSESKNPTWKMLGTHKPARAAEGVAHEGYGGWTWQRFATHYEPNPDGTYRKQSSPFVSLDEDGKPRLDVARYLKEHCEGEQPDYVIFMLGINDCFSAPPDDPTGIDARIDAMFEHAETLLKSFREAAPEAEFGICLTTPPNSRQAAFEANYQDRYTRWGWKRIQHRLVQRQLEKFKGQEKAKLFVIPTQLNLDPIDGYPANNGVHPNAVGYQQIGVSIYAWLKSRLME